MRKHVADAGLQLLNGTDLASRAEVVVVGGHERPRLRRPEERHARRCGAGPDFLATSRDPTYPMPDGLWPGTGAILAAVEYASGRRRRSWASRSRSSSCTALDRLGEGRTLVVGDRMDSDVAAAASARLDAALVLTGGHGRGGRGARTQPVAVADSHSLALTPWRRSVAGRSH